MKYGTPIFLAFCFCLVTIFGFQNKNITKPDNSGLPKLVKVELEMKLAKFRKIILDKCKKKAIDAAEVFVDSLVAEELKFNAGDTLAFPSKPVRPGLPEKIILDDTTGIAPIIR